MINFSTLLLVVLLVVSNAQEAHAYVDPGMTFVLLQGLFALIMGGITAWVLRPWNYIKKFFTKTSPNAEATEEITPEGESGNDDNGMPKGSSR